MVEPLYIIIIVAVIILGITIVEFNKFIRLRNKIKQAKSSIDIYLTQRFDLIPNLVECVKAYAEHEKETLSKVTELRSKYNNEKLLKDGAELNNLCNRLIAVGESNPDLKASEQFLNLQKALTQMESQLQAARRLYNGDVTLYNTAISSFPNLIFAKIFGFKEESLFVIDEYKKENIKIDM